MLFLNDTKLRRSLFDDMDYCAIRIVELYKYAQKHHSLTSYERKYCMLKDRLV